MNITQQKINLIFLVLLTSYAAYSVIFLNSSMFFIIYLFWFDEVIRSISAFVQIKLYKEDVRNPSEFTKYQALNNVKTQFFFLFVYSVFIIIVFGLFFFLLNGTKDEVVTNVRIFVFQDLTFNICLMIAIVREAIQIRLRYYNRLMPLKRISAMNGHILTLHLSIIFGGLAWAVTSGKFENFKLDLGEYNKFAVAIPFFIIKFLVDFYQIRHADDGKDTLIENLQS